VKAVIYAAGQGIRLGAMHARQPKILLSFGGKSLLEWHALRLTTIGITGMIVVTGFERAEVRRAMEEFAGRYPLRLQEVFNPDFTEGSVLSMHASLPVLRECREALAPGRETTDRPPLGPLPGVLLMDGDVLYPAAMLARLVRSPHETVLLYDRNYSTADDDPVLVPIRDGRPVEFRKCWRGEADAVGESVGFFKIGPADLPMLIEETEKRARGAGRRESYDEVLRAMVLAGRFHGEDVTGLPWTELDFPADVVHATEEVLPAIQALEDA